MNLIIAYIIPAIFTFLLVRYFAKEEDLWDNARMLLAIVIGLIPIMNWIGAVIYFPILIGYLTQFILDKFNKTDFSQKFYRWLRSKPKV